MSLPTSSATPALPSVPLLSIQLSTGSAATASSAAPHLLDKWTVSDVLEFKRRAAATGDSKVAARSGSDVKAAPAKLPLNKLVPQLLEGAHPVVLVTDGDAADAPIQGSIAEKDYVTKLHHGSYAPADVFAGDIQHASLPITTSRTPVTALLRSLLQLGRRHAFLLKETAVPSFMELGQSMASYSAAARAVSSRKLLTAQDLEGLVSLRDIMAFLSESIVHGAAAERDSASSSGSGKQREEAGAAEESSSSSSSSGLLSSSLRPLLHWNSELEDLLTEMRVQRGDQALLLNCQLEDNLAVADVVNVMAERGMSCVAVLERDGRLAGVFTSRDLLSRVLAPGLNAAELPIQQAMTAASSITTVPPERSVLKACRVMAMRGFRHIPVVDGRMQSKPVLGIVSMADLAHALITPPPAGEGEGAEEGEGKLAEAGHPASSSSAGSTTASQH